MANKNHSYPSLKSKRWDQTFVQCPCENLNLTTRLPKIISIICFYFFEPCYSHFSKADFALNLSIFKTCY